MRTKGLNTHRSQQNRNLGHSRGSQRPLDMFHQIARAQGRAAWVARARWYEYMCPHTIARARRMHALARHTGAVSLYYSRL